MVINKSFDKSWVKKYKPSDFLAWLIITIITGTPIFISSFYILPEKYNLISLVGYIPSLILTFVIFIRHIPKLDNYARWRYWWHISIWRTSDPKSISKRYNSNWYTDSKDFKVIESIKNVEGDNKLDYLNYRKLWKQIFRGKEVSIADFKLFIREIPESVSSITIDQFNNMTKNPKYIKSINNAIGKIESLKVEDNIISWNRDKIQN